ncbi:hypothetical protein C8R43DRAFT_1127440 [Mycena crocata]|nr:hypothetical protein C8R43DRAFT_1127440 [Mycena crocata]
MSSPFADKLGTNYTPQDEEMADIKALLVEPSLHLASLTGEIAAMQRAINKLTTERDGLAAYVDAHRALISPVRRIPLDIIQEIFIACMPTHRNCVMSAAEAPVLLGRICSSWRSISLATPRLWSRLHIAQPISPPFEFHPARLSSEEKLAQRSEITKMWLDRARQCPLSISLYSSPQNLAVSPYPIMAAILPFASRWEIVKFWSPAAMLETAAQLTPADVPMLKSLSINGFYTHTPSSIQWASFGLLQASGLSRLSLSLPMSMAPVLKLPVAWNLLTELAISDAWSPGAVPMSSQTALRLLPWCPLLRTCRLQVQDDPSDDSRALDPVFEHTSIYTFDLTCTRFFEITLHRLAHGDSSLPTDSPLLLASPLLERLDIGIYAFTQTFLAPLFGSLSHTLRKIEITDVEEQWEQHARMTDGVHPTLKRVVVDCARPMQQDILPDLRRFMEAGLRVELSYVTPHVFRYSPWQGLDDVPNDP